MNAKEEILTMNSKAMTLMEVLIVVVLIGVMAGFALASYRKTFLKATERDAVLNLTVLHGANKIYQAKNSSYWDTNDISVTDLDVINQTLGTNIVANTAVVYSYRSNVAVDPNAFTAEAAYTDGTASNNFTLRVNETSISSTNPCCGAGNCPSRPACP